VLDRPDGIEAKILGHAREGKVLLVNLTVSDTLPTIRTEQKLKPNTHLAARFSADGESARAVSHRSCP